MNLERWLKAIFLALYRLLYGVYGRHFRAHNCTRARQIATPWKFQPAFQGAS